MCSQIIQSFTQIKIQAQVKWKDFYYMWKGYHSDSVGE